MRCDAIKATFRGESIFHEGEIRPLFDVRLVQLQQALGGEWEYDKKTFNGYRSAYLLKRNGDVICRALTDGSGDAEGTHQIEQQGHYSAEVREALNQIIGQFAYATARRDTCLDLIDDENFTLFHSLNQLAKEMCAKKRITYSQQGQGWLIPGETMTIYMGSRNSPVMIRIYTRGLKTLKEGGEDNPYRIRIEVEVKPGKREGKQNLSLLEDHALFGCAAWSKEFMERSGVLERVERHKVGTVWKLTDKQKTFAHLVKQYGGLLEEIIQQHGADGLAKMISDQRKDLLRVRDVLQTMKLESSVDQW